MVISITDGARDQVKEMMKDESEGVRLRFGIKAAAAAVYLIH